MLIEVTCIKWNLIGTDTGSLTDRHDADGLRGEGGGTGNGDRRGEAERRRIKDLFASASARNSTERSVRIFFCGEWGGGVEGIRIKPAGKVNAAFRPSHICLLIGG